jgi:hypothetical protein
VAVVEDPDILERVEISCYLLAHTAALNFLVAAAGAGLASCHCTGFEVLVTRHNLADSHSCPVDNLGHRHMVWEMQSADTNCTVA